jgi:hypothetical protein
MKSYKLILAIVIGLLLLISMKACIDNKRSELTKTISPKIKYEVASQGRESEVYEWKLLIKES